MIAGSDLHAFIICEGTVLFLPNDDAHFLSGLLRTTVAGIHATVIHSVLQRSFADCSFPRYLPAAAAVLAQVILVQGDQVICLMALPYFRA